MKALKFSFIIFSVVLISQNLFAQINTSQSGSWTDSATWVSGAIPSVLDDVIIGSGIVVSVDDSNAVCQSLSFADTSGHIDMNANSMLSIYGDFTIFDETHNVFSEGWSSSNAVVRFTGEAVQSIKNFKHLGPSTSFRDLVIDKTAGKVVTDTLMSESIGIQNSFTILRGEFILSEKDDIEGRFAMSTSLGATPSITIHPEGIFTMVGSSSHIRKNTSNHPIGKMTIYGSATLTTSSTNQINLSDIDIETGGKLQINTGWSSNKFNPGTITIKSGGAIRNITTTNFWVDTAKVVLENGGTYETSSSTTTFCPNFTNKGTVRYLRNSSVSDQTIADIDYYRLELSFASSDTKKNWSLEADRVIEDSLEINNSAELVITSASPDNNIMVNKALRLTSGSINNSDPNCNIQLADSAEISKATGSIINSPVFGSSVDLKYTSSVASVVTGPEFPTTDIINNLTIWSNDQTVTLGSNAKINGNLTLSNGTFDNNGEADDLVLTMANGSTIRVASGMLSSEPSFESLVNLEYISTLNQATTALEVPSSSIALNNLTISGDKGVILGSDVHVNGLLEITGSELITGDYMVTLSPTASLIEENGFSLNGSVQTSRNVSQNISESFGGIGFELSSGADDLGNVIVTRVTGDNGIVTINENNGIARKWNVISDNPPASGRDLTLSWGSYEDNGIEFSSTNKAQVYRNNGSSWDVVGTAADVSASDPRSIAVTTTSFSDWTVGSESNPLPVELSKPFSYALEQNYPNPFNPTTVISYQLPESGHVNLTVFDILGEEIATLVNEEKNAGNYSVQFNASNLASGMYFYRIQAGKFVNIKKMVLIK